MPHAREALNLNVKGAAPHPRRPRVRRLSAGLAEATETLRAIQRGAVDAFVVRTPQGNRVFTLQGANHPYRVLVEQMEEGAATVSTDGTILYANRYLGALLGTVLEQLIGASIYAYIPRSDQPAVRALLKHGRRGSWRTEMTLRVAHDTAVPVTVAANPVRAGGNKVVCLILTDLRDRRRAEGEIRQHQAELAHVLRLNTMGELAAEFAHRVNQPLTAIANDLASCAAYVKPGRTVSRKLIALLEEVGAEAMRAGDIVRHFLRFARERGSAVKATNLNGLVHNVARLLDGEIVRQEITLELDLTKRPIPVCVDSIEIEQVLLNLVQNSMDAVRRTASQRKMIQVQTRKTQDAMAEVTVRDLGRGPSNATAKRLFEAFFTTKARGLGMGLAISRSIVEAHHGRIWLDARGGAGGTTVRFTLPLQRPERRSPRTRRSPRGPNPAASAIASAR